MSYWWRPFSDLEFHPSEIKKLERIRGLFRELWQLELYYPDRICSMEIAQILVQNRKALQKKTEKPVAIVISGRVDWNYALRRHPVAFDQ